MILQSLLICVKQECVISFYCLKLVVAYRRPLFTDQEALYLDNTNGSLVIVGPSTMAISCTALAVWITLVEFKFTVVVCSTGYYIYIETSAHRPNDSARIVSPSVNTQQATCVLFWYHMYGSDVNQLSMYVETGSQLGTPFWTISGSRGDQWHYAQVETGALSNAKVTMFMCL